MMKNSDYIVVKHSIFLNKGLKSQQKYDFLLMDSSIQIIKRNGWLPLGDYNFILIFFFSIIFIFFFQSKKVSDELKIKSQPPSLRKRGFSRSHSRKATATVNQNRNSRNEISCLLCR